ncbi:MAG TPA: AraC family transcriptional regulator [Leeuwenhoekiella sp.]|nr:AraC family transcriptional regulator [Leeuwenhoekiella sp.]
MKPRFEDIPQRKLIGMRIATTISFDDTAQLWKEFVSRQDEIKNKKDSGYYSLQVYPENLKMENFTESTTFERWAAVEVSDFESIPDGMEKKLLSGGKYAVFTHVGPVKTFVETSNHIYSEWLPASEYQLDARAHFERLGEKYYGPEHPESEEEIWVPVRIKNV